MSEPTRPLRDDLPPARPTAPADGETVALPAGQTPQANREEPRWVGSAAVPSGPPERDRRRPGYQPDQPLSDTLDLPADPYAADPYAAGPYQSGPPGQSQYQPLGPPPSAYPPPQQYEAPQYQAPQYQAPQYQAPQPQYQTPQHQNPQYQRGPQGPPPGPAPRRGERGREREGWDRRPRRRRRKWPWVLLTMLLGAAACCGLVVRGAQPYVEQWPAAVSDSRDVTGLTQVTDAKRRKSANTLLDKIDKWYYQDSFVTLYTETAASSHQVTAFGVTRFIKDTDSALGEALATLQSDLNLASVTTLPGGDRHVALQCGTGQVGGQTTVACGWADHGSLGIVLFTGRSQDSGAALTRQIRTTLIERHTF